MRKLIGLLLLGVFFLSSCVSTPSPQASPFSSPLFKNESPVATPVVVAGNEEEQQLPVYPFNIDKPVQAGATRVTGNGPPGIPISLADLTFGGQVLAYATIDAKGEFVFRVDTPLVLNHRIGITVGDLTGTGWQRQDFDERFYGGEARTVPQVGFYFDTCLVRE